jgi:hypothetical protein
VLQIAEGSLEESRLAGTGGADEIIDKEPFVPKEAPILGGEAVILGKEIFFYPDDAARALLLGGMVVMVVCRATTAICTHAQSTSTSITRNSSPWRRSREKPPQLGQATV